MFLSHEFFDEKEKYQFFNIITKEKNVCNIEKNFIRMITVLRQVSYLIAITKSLLLAMYLSNVFRFRFFAFIAMLDRPLKCCIRFLISPLCDHIEVDSYKKPIILSFSPLITEKPSCSLAVRLDVRLSRSLCLSSGR